jgi:hypothetical protein
MAKCKQCGNKIYPTPPSEPPSDNPHLCHLCDAVDFEIRSEKYEREKSALQKGIDETNKNM